jgi:hypothetical protein
MTQLEMKNIWFLRFSAILVFVVLCFLSITGVLCFLSSANSSRAGATPRGSAQINHHDTK